MLRVFLWHRASGGDITDITAAYHEISRKLQGTPGLIRNELLRVSGDPSCLLVASEWESTDTFQEFVDKAGHHELTAPLRPYRDEQHPRPFEILEVIETY